MKTWIIVSVAFLISGCAKSDEGKCKDKGWFWHEATKECKETPPEGTSTSAETQESCKTKSGYVWNTGSSQCKKIDYFMLIHPADSEIANVFLGLKEGNNISISKEAYTKKGGCVKVPEPYVLNLIVQVKTSSWAVGGWSEICNSHLVEEEKKCKSGIYELNLNSDDDVILQSVTLDAERTDCDILKLDSGN